MNLEEQLRELFVEEAGDALRDFEQALLLLESLPDDPELVAKLFRNVHTLKGNSRILGFTSIETFAHELESLLDAVRQHDLIVDSHIADVLLRGLDVLKELVTEVSGGAQHNSEGYRAAAEAVSSTLKKLSPAVPVRASVQRPEEPTRVSLAAAMYRSNPRPPSVRPPDSTLKIPSLNPPPGSMRPPPTVIASSPPRAAAPPSAPVEPPQAAKAEAAVIADDAPAPKPKPRTRAAPDAESNSVRVPIDKLDRLINLTGEVVIAQSIIAQLVSDLTPERVGVLQEVVAQMDRHCRELQERMLGARMLPLRNVFTRFHRLVRDLAGTTGKALRLEVSGEETELDKTVIEKISDPLTHLIRN
ncbi:MAG TPA: Hpt domain-containing protein, partial [Polyangiales bacterium]